MTAAAITTSVVTGGSNNHATVSEEANAYATDFVTQGVLGAISSTSGVAPSTGAFAVNQSSVPAMTVDITAGVVYITVTPSGQSSQRLRARMTSTYTAYAISANSTGGTRYDWIYLQASAANAANPSASADDVITLVTSRSTSNTTDNGTPPTYGTLLAVVTVVNGASSISNASIADRRTQSSLSSQSAVTDWTLISGTPDTITALGNRSYSMVYNSVDLTGYLNPGTRIRTTRTVAAPTQCTSLNGTTQYYSKSSPAGMSFTTTWTDMAWIKLTSYNGSNQYIGGRRNSTTEGFTFRVTSTGQLEAAGYRIASNNKVSTTFQSVPLNRWVHVAVTVDMTAGASSGFTFYIDGVSVPTTTVQTGTATAIVQSSNPYTVGADTAGALPFGGKIAQKALFSAVLTQATILQYMNQGLLGTETSLISAHSFNNSIADLNTTNANNLTASGSAVATNADSPFGTQASGSISSTLDYGIVQSVSFSTNTTVIVQVPEGCTIPTSGGISAVSYSSMGKPYGFPSSAEKFTIYGINKSDIFASGTTINTWYNLNVTLGVPIGEWKISYQVALFNVSNSSQTAIREKFTLSESSATEDDLEFTSYAGVTSPTGSLVLIAQCYKEKTKKYAAAVTLYGNVEFTAGSTSLHGLQGGNSPSVLKVVNAYL